MDRYDALLEHLKSTRRHGLDSVANRLNALVNDIETFVETMKSSVQDALPSNADEIFPMAEFESGLAEIRDASVEAPAPLAGISLDNFRILDRARSQSELLRALLPVLCDHVGRAVVLVIRDGVVTAWSGMGFDDSDSIRSWNGGIAASPDFSGLADSREPRLIDPSKDPLISDWMAGQNIPVEGALLPISLRGKLMGIIYVDHTGEQPWNLESAQALSAVACLLIDTLQHRAEGPSPMLVEIAAVESAAAEAQEPEILGPPVESTQGAEEFRAEQSPAPVIEAVPDTPIEVAEPEVAPASVEPPAPVEVAVETPSVPDEPVEDEVIEVEDYDFEPEPAAEEFDPSATMRVEVAEESPVQRFEPEPVADVPPPMAEPAPQSVVPPSVEEMEAPPPVRPIEPPVEEQLAGGAGGLSADDEARHEEARRFARLLVSEIKLYNEDEVDRGRSEKDLGMRLKDDIERSREMFEKRIPADIRTGHDYFQEELIRILADGDADALGV